MDEEPKNLYVDDSGFWFFVPNRLVYEKFCEIMDSIRSVNPIPESENFLICVRRHNKKE